MRNDSKSSPTRIKTFANMKRLLLIMFSALAVCHSFAQGDAYGDILAEGKTWNYYYFSFYYKERHWGWSHEDELTIESKEEVDGKEYYLVRYELKTYCLHN